MRSQFEYYRGILGHQRKRHSASESVTVLEFDIGPLLASARHARDRSYCPYSGYAVGAALLSEDGTIFNGCNVENAAYPVGVCAERVALTGAVCAGYRSFSGLVILTTNGGAPCGICRQALSEFSPNLIIISVNDRGETRRFSLADLLPDAFGPKDLSTTSDDR